jgi:hypothetical protein
MILNHLLNFLILFDAIIEPTYFNYLIKLIQIVDNLHFAASDIFNVYLITRLKAISLSLFNQTYFINFFILA